MGASVGFCYFPLVVAMCFPVEQGRLFMIQVLLCVQWLGAGISKMGPWWPYCWACLLQQSLWLRSNQQTLRLMYVLEGGRLLCMRPIFTLFAHCLAVVEWACPLLLCLPTCMPVFFGIAGLSGMYVSINLIVAEWEFYQWNTFLMISVIYLFGFANLGLDTSGLHKLNGLQCSFILLEFGYLVVANLLPDWMSRYLGHRQFAGNWHGATFLVRKSAIHRFDVFRTIAPPPWEPLPAWLTPNLHPEQLSNSTYRMIAALWLMNLNQKILPSLIWHALDKESIDEFLILDGIDLLTWLQGHAEDGGVAEQALPALLHCAGFQPGECRCVYIGAFPFLRHTASWKIQDVALGLLSSGSHSVRVSTSVDSLPSAGISLMPLLGQEQGALLHT